MSDMDFGRELEIHDPFLLPDELELEHEINRPKWWYAQQLRLAGATWDEIATALGYASGATAHTTVKRELVKAEVTRQSRQEIIDLDLERLDMLQLVIWRSARQGDLKAMEMVLKIMATRHKLIRVDEAEIDEESAGKSTIVIGGDEDDYLAGIRKAQELHRKPIEGEVVQ